ncbi:hypothetical protein GCM10023259_089050 [Thermocatellispora tengchongensis]
MGAWWLEWPPGSRCEYHATSAHWVLVPEATMGHRITLQPVRAQGVEHPAPQCLPEVLAGHPVDHLRQHLHRAGPLEVGLALHRDAQGRRRRAG